MWQTQWQLLVDFNYISLFISILIIFVFNTQWKWNQTNINESTEEEIQFDMFRLFIYSWTSEDWMHTECPAGGSTGFNRAQEGCDGVSQVIRWDQRVFTRHRKISDGFSGNVWGYGDRIRLKEGYQRTRGQDWEASCSHFLLSSLHWSIYFCVQCDFKWNLKYFVSLNFYTCNKKLLVFVVVVVVMVTLMRHCTLN